MRKINWPAAIVCALLTIISYVLSMTATVRKSVTVDEPLHFAGAYAHVFLHDFHVDPENPPLWKYLIMLPIHRSDLSGDLDTAKLSEVFERSRHDQAKLPEWVYEVLYGPDGALRGGHAQTIERSHYAMALAGAALVALACALGGWLGGSPAAIVAGLLLAFDPLILGHSPLIKNDVLLSLVALAICGALIALLRRMTLGRVAFVAVLCGVSIAIKFSGAIYIPFIAVALLLGAMRHGIRRIVLSIVAVIGIALASWLIIWASYGFRFGAFPGEDSKLLMDHDFFLRAVARRSLLRDHLVPPTTQEIVNWKPDISTRVILWADEHRLLPDPFCMGLIFTHGYAIIRPGYLFGEVKPGGWWYYFPLAVLFKTPTVTLIAMALAGIAAVRRVFLPLLVGRSGGEGRGEGASRVESLASSERPHPNPLSPRRLFDPEGEGTRHPAIAIALACIGGGFFVVAMFSGMNIGIRHVMPAIPIAYLAVALAFARFWRARRKRATVIVIVLAIGLMTESLLAWPDYIAFFNAPSGGSRGGLHLLGDSNLDWGQDLPLLKKWQDAHPDVKLYTLYFGGMLPEDYGITCTALPGSMAYYTAWPNGPGVIAISATNLQAIYLPPELRSTYLDLQTVRPREVLGGTIYLYDFPLRDSSK